MVLVFVHGLSVTSTETYGGLPDALKNQAVKAGLQLDVQHIFLGRYISFHDEVTMADLVRAFQYALETQLLPTGGARSPIPRFSCITHSTGGPVVRAWVDRYYGKGGIGNMPLEHLIMLAPANHGSALAQLGKSRLSRIKSWFSGVEPGQQVLNWLELGSDEQLTLNRNWMDYPAFGDKFYPVVLTGQSIHESLYDHLNSYTGEAGSDGVVRVSAANLNYRWVRLKENPAKTLSTHPLIKKPEKEQLPTELEIEDHTVITSKPVPLGVLPNTGHSGEEIGVMRSVKPQDTPDTKPVVKWILETLNVRTLDDYQKLDVRLTALTEVTQKTPDLNEKLVPKCSMVIFRLTDDKGRAIMDYDLYLLGGTDMSPDSLPKGGFFVDRQRNSITPNVLTYYFNDEVMENVPDKKLGICVVARPDEGFVYYRNVVFQSTNFELRDLLLQNQTLVVDIILKRRVDREIFRLYPADAPMSQDFHKAKPSGDIPD